MAVDPKERPLRMIEDKSGRAAPKGVDWMRPPERENLFYRSAKLLAQILASLLFRFRALGYRNVPVKGGVILASNHQSFLDPVLIGVGMRRPVTYMARDTLFKNTLLGWLLRMFYSFPVKRDAMGLDAMRMSMRLLEAGHMIVIFPEGTRSRDGSVGEFKPGVAVLAARARVPVVPVYIEGTFHNWPRTNKVFSMRMVRVLFGEPLIVKGSSKEELQLAADEIRARVAALRDRRENESCETGFLTGRNP